MNCVVVSDSSQEFKEATSVADLSDTKGTTVFGTFRFTPTDPLQTHTASSKLLAVSLSEIFETLDDDEGVIVKIDIEGGEHYLFDQDVNWMSKTTMLVIELHDRFHPTLSQSSYHVVNCLAKFNFAVVPGKDVLYCFNRNLLSL